MSNFSFVQAGAVLPYLPDTMWQLLLNHLSTRSFTALPYLAEAIASSSGHEVSGLITMPEEPVLPYLAFILGGLMGCLRSSDWQTRRSAVNAIKAVMLVLGKALTEQQVVQVHQSVLDVKHDLAKNVRAAVSDCLPIFADLMVSASIFAFFTLS